MTRRRSMLPVRMARLARMVLLVLLVLLVPQLGCASPKPPQSPPTLDDESGVLVPTDQLSTPPFKVVQRLTGKHGSEDVAFECVVELSRGKLTVIGTTPYRTRAFMVEQNGIDVQFQKFMLRDVPIEPLHVLYDVHRLFFRGLPGAQRNGIHELVDHDELVRERWRGGQLVERRFHALDTFSSLTVIRFEGAPAPVIAPRVRLTNLHHGYSLEIEHVEQNRLEQGYTLDVEQRPAL